MYKSNNNFEKALLLCILTISLFISACNRETTGCTDPQACNYDPTADISANNCEFGDTWYEDKDGDGLGNPNVSMVACEQPVGFVSDNTDSFDLVIGSEQRAVIAYIGATWCPPCGQLGGPLLDYVEQNNNTGAIILSFQNSDDISPFTSIAKTYVDEIVDETDFGGIPHLFAGGADYLVDRGLFTNPTTNEVRIDQDIQLITLQEAVVGIDASAQFINAQVQVSVGLKFLKSQNEAYHIATYLLEDNVVTDQKVGSVSNPILEENVNHNNIVRTNFDGSTSFRGRLIGNAFEAGDLISESFTISIPDLPVSVQEVNTENIKVAVIVWKGDEFGMSNGILVDL